MKKKLRMNENSNGKIDVCEWEKSAEGGCHTLIQRKQRSIQILLAVTCNSDVKNRISFSFCWLLPPLLPDSMVAFSPYSIFFFFAGHTHTLMDLFRFFISLLTHHCQISGVCKRFMLFTWVVYAVRIYAFVLLSKQVLISAYIRYWPSNRQRFVVKRERQRQSEARVNGKKLLTFT